MTQPTPALVSQRAAERLPRLALLLFCAAYILPGLFGRDPWRSADLTAFGYMADLARGGDWFAPRIAGIAADGALLPYWIGAAAIHLLSPWVDPALAARLPFALLLVGVLVFTWYGCYHLARTDAAQPLPFAFGGEAQPVDYARAIADGALLALTASLGLLQLGHETTPELAQLFAVALFVYAMAASSSLGWQPRAAVLVALPMLAASGAPAIGLGLALAGLVVCLRSSYAPARRFVPWLAASAVAAAAVGAALGVWAWRASVPASPGQLLQLLGWFTWPAWALAAWTLWRWRQHLMHRHIAVPGTAMLVAVTACGAMQASDRALLLALPPLAVLAAFALPTLQRSVAAAVDWFSVGFFSLGAIWMWVIYASLQFGVPAKPAANVAKLAPGYPGGFSALALGAAAAGTLAWLALVRWRTGRHRHPLWKSLVLPAGGVTLWWLLAMTLLLPVLDYARSLRPLVERIAVHVPAGACVVTRGVPRPELAALEVHGGWRVIARDRDDAPAGCDHLLAPVRARASDASLQRPGWTLVARERRPTERGEQTAVYRRDGASVR
ncbi:MAG TPA: hypothetical protein VLI72_05950 [Methylibium sp.]|nr:hypothetical protein [Methylibium sp.]